MQEMPNRRSGMVSLFPLFLLFRSSEILADFNDIISGV
jgi:hypothetical protein